MDGPIPGYHRHEYVATFIFQDEGLAKLAEQVLNQILKAQASKHEGQKPYERTDERQGYRNGRRERSLTTRIGKLVLDVPRLRCGEFSTDMFERYQRSEQALLISLRKVKNIVEKLCGCEF